MNNRDDITQIAPGGNGYWRVTTEADDEGMRTRDLGTHHGNIVDIAWKLADRAYYGLRFEPMKPNSLEQKPDKGLPRVNISLNIGTGTWDMDGNERARYFGRWLDEVLMKRGDTQIVPGQYHACVTLTREDLREKKKNDLAKKLSPEEIAFIKENM